MTSLDRMLCTSLMKRFGNPSGNLFLLSFLIKREGHKRVRKGRSKKEK